MPSSQFSANAPWSPRTTGPRTRTCVSRQWSGPSASPIHSAAIPTPPVIPTLPSATSARRWVRLATRLIAYGFGGRKMSTSAPASRISRIRPRSICAEPSASRITLQRAPSRALSRIAPGDLIGDLAAPVDVGLHVQRPLGGADRLQERGEDPVAVDEQLGLVPGRDRRPGERLGGAQEVGRADVELGPDLVAEGALTPVAQAVGGVPAERRRRRRRRAASTARGPPPPGLPPRHTRQPDVQLAQVRPHRPTTTSNARGSAVNSSRRSSISSPSTLKPASASVSTSIRAPEAVTTPSCSSTRPARSP